MSISIPEEAQLLCDQYIRNVRNDTNHNLRATDRFTLYESFGFSRLSISGYSKFNQKFNDQKYDQFIQDAVVNYTLADYVLSWLAVVTTKHVLPCWEREEVWMQYPFNRDNDYTPQQILQVAEGVLQKTVDVEYAQFQLGEYSIGRSISDYSTLDVAFTYNAAYLTLNLILLGGANLKQLSPYIDDDINMSNDFASEAVKAYTVIDNNLPGEVYSGKITIPITFNIEKRLEFWEWWLTEAIPQAWELAQQSVENK